MMNPVTISVAAVTLVAGTVVYLDHNQTADMRSTVNTLNNEPSGFHELKEKLILELDTKRQARIDAANAARQFAPSQIPSAGYGEPLKPF